MVSHEAMVLAVSKLSPQVREKAPRSDRSLNTGQLVVPEVSYVFLQLVEVELAGADPLPVEVFLGEICPCFVSYWSKNCHLMRQTSPHELI